MAVTWKELAFKDEVASLSDNDPADIGTAADDGSGSAASRYDHVHELGAACINSTTLFAADVVDGAAIADDAVNAAELAAMSAAVNFGGYQGVDMVVHQASSAPTAVVGKLWQDTDSPFKLYICTAV